MPTLSVILPVYNAASFIRETVDSILAQSFGDFELLCIDDGSTDDTPSLLEDYAQSDNRIRIIRQENGGPGAARNTGLDNARGEYVYMLDSDDLYDQKMFETMYQRAIETGADTVVCRSTLFDDASGKDLESSWVIKSNQLPASDTFTPHEMQDYVFTAFMGWPWDKLYKRSFIEKNHLRYPGLNNSEDLYLVFLSIAKSSVISVVDEPLIRHRMNRNGSVSASRANAPLDFYKSICLLKATLDKDGLLDKYSWSFYNWALEYLVWNIDTMDDPSGRATQLHALANHEFPELELERHAGAFLSLSPANLETYLNLLREAYGVPAIPGPDEKKSLLGHLVSFLARVDADGWGTAFRAFFGYRLGLLLGKEKPPHEPVIIRSSDYMITSKEALIKHDNAMKGTDK